MTIPYDRNALSNVMKLRNLGSKRRQVGQIPNLLNDLESDLPEVSGTRSSNVPIPDTEMGGIAPESYDVRANKVMSQGESIGADEGTIFEKLGAALANKTQQPPIETVQVDRQEGIPTEPPIQEEPSMWSKIGNALRSYISPEERNKMTAENQLRSQEAQTKSTGATDNLFSGYLDPLKSTEAFDRNLEKNQRLMEDASIYAKGQNPAEYREQLDKSYQEKQILDQQEMDNALQNPMEEVVYGATQTAYQYPEIKTQVSQIIGQDYTPQIQEMVSKYEKVLSDLDKDFKAQSEGMTEAQIALQGDVSNYDEQLQRIRQRIDTNSATDMDKFYIGLALLMPVLMGVLSGKEAALGTLAGGAKGIADIYGNREAGIREDEKLMADISKNKNNAQLAEKELGLNLKKLNTESALKRSELELEKLKFPGQFQKNLPSDVNEHLIGKDQVVWQDPETGEEKVGIKILPDFVAYPEYVTSKEDLKDIRKSANELSDLKTFSESLDNVTDNIIQISDQLKNPNVFWKAIVGQISKIPGAASKITQDVMIDGRKVNAGIALKNAIGLLTNLYAKAQGLGQIDAALQRHMSNILENPTTSLQSPEDTINQVLEISSMIRNNMINSARNKGFAPEIMMQGKEDKIKKNQFKSNERSKIERSNALLK